MTRRDPFKRNEEYFRRLEESMPDPIRMMFDPTYEPDMRDDVSSEPETRTGEQPHDPEQSTEERDASELGSLRVGGESVGESSDDHHEQRPDDDDHRKIVAPDGGDGNEANRLGRGTI